MIRVMWVYSNLLSFSDVMSEFSDAEPSAGRIGKPVRVVDEAEVVSDALRVESEFVR